MAVDMFLKLSGVAGEAADNSHTDEIDIIAWHWGMAQSGTMHTGHGGGAGKVKVGDINVTKHIDNSTATLMQFCCKGTHIEEGTITVRKAGDDPLEYLLVTMKQIMITSVQTGGQSDQERLTEHITLNFREFEVKYTKQGEAGGGAGAVVLGWDISKNKSV